MPVPSDEASDPRHAAGRAISTSSPRRPTTRRCRTPTSRRRGRAAHLEHVPHRLAVGRAVGLHPDLHAGRRASSAAGMNWWQAVLTIMLGNLIVLRARWCSSRTRARASASRSPCWRAPSFGILGSNVPGAAARARGLRLVRHPDLDRRPGDLHDAEGRAARSCEPPFAAALGFARLLALEHVHRRARQRVDQVPRGLGRAVPDRGGARAARAGPTARAGGLGPDPRPAEPVRDHGRVPASSSCPRSPRWWASGRPSRSTSPTSRATPATSARRCGASSSACRRP